MKKHGKKILITCMAACLFMGPAAFSTVYAGEPDVLMPEETQDSMVFKTPEEVTEEGKAAFPEEPLPEENETVLAEAPLPEENETVPQENEEILLPEDLMEVSEDTRVIVRVTGIRLSESKITLGGHNSYQLTASVVPGNADNRDIIWTSSNPAAAAVDETGLVTAVYRGKTTVTARSKDGGFKKTCTVTVDFGDVMSGHPYYQAVGWGADKKITNGYKETNTFGVNDPCTRGHIVMFLWKAAGKPAPKSMQQAFSDVGSSHPFFKAVQWAYGSGITKGVTADLFGVNQPCTRGQAMVFLWRYMGKPNTVTADYPLIFSDKEALSNTFQKAILWGSVNQITKGSDDGSGGKKFRPNDTCTRGHVMMFLYRLMNHVGSHTHTWKPYYVTRLEYVTDKYGNPVETGLEYTSFCYSCGLIEPGKEHMKETDYEHGRTWQNGVFKHKKATKTHLVYSYCSCGAAKDRIDLEPIWPLADISFNQITIYTGEPFRLYAQLCPEDEFLLPENADQYPIRWKSSNEQIARVDGTGLITPLKAGKVTITASDGGPWDCSCSVTIRDKVVATGLAVNAENVVISVGEEFTVTAQPIPLNTNYYKNLNWMIGDTSVIQRTANTNSSYTVKGLKPGTTTIDIYWGFQYFKTVNVTVR